jgi:glycerol-3-phosphate acyltransferase PlsY
MSRWPRPRSPPRSATCSRCSCGSAAASGVLIALDPWLAAGTIATWLIIAFFFRYSSLAALTAAAFAPFFAFFLYGMGRFAWEGAIGVTVIALLIAWRHQSNIRNLIAGTEGRIGGGGSGSPQS